MGRTCWDVGGYFGCWSGFGYDRGGTVVMTGRMGVCREYRDKREMILDQIRITVSNPDEPHSHGNRWDLIPDTYRCVDGYKKEENLLSQRQVPEQSPSGYRQSERNSERTSNCLAQPKRFNVHPRSLQSGKPALRLHSSTPERPLCPSCSIS